MLVAMCIFFNRSTRLEPLLIKALNECYLAHLMLIKVALCDDNKTLEICFLLAMKIMNRCFYINPNIYIAHTSSNNCVISYCNKTFKVFRWLFISACDQSFCSIFLPLFNTVFLLNIDEKCILKNICSIM